MIARVITLHLRADKLDEASQLLTHTSHRTNTLPGLRGELMLVDRERCKRMVIGIWETEGDLRASERDDLWRHALAGAAHLLTSTPTQETYQIEGQITFQTEETQPRQT